MALKFDGKYLKDGGKILCTLDGKLIRDGRGGTPLCNIDGKLIRDGRRGGTPLCNIDGDYIRDGRRGGTKLIKVSDAARKIGATSLGPTTAAMWYKFCR